MTRKGYVVPSVEIRDAAVSESVIWFYIILSLAAIAVVSTYSLLCHSLGGHFSWGVHYVWFVPYNIWVKCAS